MGIFAIECAELIQHHARIGELAAARETRVAEATGALFSAPWPQGQGALAPVRTPVPGHHLRRIARAGDRLRRRRLLAGPRHRDGPLPPRPVAPRDPAPAAPPGP